MGEKNIMGQTRETTERNIESLYRQFNEIFEFMNRQIFDDQREEIKDKLENLLGTFNNAEYREGINRLNDEGYKEYEGILRALFYKMTMGKSSDFYFNNLNDNPVFRQGQEMESGYQMLNVQQVTSQSSGMRAANVARHLEEAKCSLERERNICNDGIESIIIARQTRDAQITRLIEDSRRYTEDMRRLGINVGTNYNTFEAVLTASRVTWDALFPIYKEPIASLIKGLLPRRFRNNLDFADLLGRWLERGTVSVEDIIQFVVRQGTKISSAFHNLLIAIDFFRANYRAVVASSDLINTVSRGITGYDTTMAEIRQSQRNEGFSTEIKIHLRTLGSTYIALSAAITFIERMLSTNNNPNPNWLVSNEPDTRRIFHDVLMTEIDRIISRITNIPVSERRSTIQYYSEEGYRRTMIALRDEFGIDNLFRMVSLNSYHETFRGHAELWEENNVLAMRASILNSLFNSTLEGILSEIRNRYSGWMRRKL
jgi:hypothetical protein